MVMCSDIYSEASARPVGSDAVTDSSTENVVTESSSSVSVRPKRHSMALAVDSDVPPDSADVLHFSNYVLNYLFTYLLITSARRYCDPSCMFVCWYVRY